MSNPAAPTVVFEDNHLLLLNKPAGLLAQGDNTGDPSIVTWAQEYLRVTYNKPGNIYAALLHRIDRPVSGLILLAKTSKAAARLTEQFKGRSLRKIYLALTERVPNPPEAVLEDYLAKLPGKNIIRAYDKPAYGAQIARLRYTLLQDLGGRALVQVEPETGRQHQIRVQLAKIGCVLVGDVKYGKTAFLPDQSIALHAFGLEIEHPITKERTLFTAPPPAQPWWQAADPGLAQL